MSMVRSFQSDGELYNASLQRETSEEALELFKRILKRIEENGFITILDIVIFLNEDFQMPRNPVYAASHGWNLNDVTNFYMHKHDNGNWGVYLGTPRKVTSENIGKTEVVVGGNCIICGKQLNPGRLFICKECESNKKHITRH